MCSFRLATGQTSVILKSNGLLETDFYHNRIIALDDGFFVLFNSIDSRSRLVLSKYDDCNNHLWTKRYRSSFDLDLQDVLVYNNKLIILLVTHFNSSTTRTPILLRMNLSGEIEFSNRYNKNKFDNFINLSQHANQYHIMGPSTGTPDGGGHFVINELGDLIYSNVLSDTINNSGKDFGCTVLKNGMVIRRHNNTLIACDNMQNVIWAKKFENFGQLSMSETKPLALEDGFVQFSHQGGELVLFKMDYSGDIVWSILGLGGHYNTPTVINDNEISFFWRSLNSEGDHTSCYTKVEQSDGAILLNKVFEIDDGSVLSWPSISTNSKGDIFISGSVGGDAIEDLVLKNPHLSECTSVSESPVFIPFDIDILDITNNYEITPVSVSQDVVNFSVSDIAPLIALECRNLEKLEIDTSLDCHNSFVFNGNLYGSKFIWSDGKTDALRTFNESQEISVLVDSCQLEKQIHLKINRSNCECQIYAPNIISSSAINLENQKMTVRSNCDLNDYSIHIFDRWGNLVFESNDVKDPWIPQNANNLSQGIYVWIIQWSSVTNPEIQIESGTITYLR